MTTLDLPVALTAPRLGFRLSRHLWTAPIILSLLVTTAFPFVFLIALSLSKSTLGKPFQKFIGLRHFSASLTDVEFWTSLAKTLTYALVSSAAQLVFGLAVALLFFGLMKSGRFLTSLILLPLMTPPVMVGVAWKLILAPAGGLLNGILLALGLDQPLSFLGTPGLAWLSIFVADLWQWTPFVVILCFAALTTLPEGVAAAASLDGAGPWARFRYITLPLIAAPLLSIYLIKLIFAFKLFDLVYILTFGGPGFATTTTGFAIYRLAMSEFEVAAAAAQTLIFATLIGLLTLPLVAALKRLEAREA